MSTPAHTSIPYAELIGAPIVAVIEAEALAARATAEFIESVGFIKAEGGQAGALGRLRTVHFTYRRQDVDGNEVLEGIDVPLLALIPIPVVQVKHAALDFNLKLHTVSEVPCGEVFATSGTRLVFKGAFAPIAPSGCSHHSEVDLKVKLEVEQADIPVGISKLFQVFDAAITHARIKPHDTTQSDAKPVGHEDR